MHLKKMQPESVVLICLLIAVVLISLAIKKLRQSHNELQQQHFIDEKEKRRCNARSAQL